MGKIILGVVAGYIAMAVLVFATFSAVYMFMGTDGAYMPGSWEVSMTWITASIVLGFVAAIVGGWLAVVLGKSQKAAVYLAGLTLVLGLIMAVMSLLEPERDLTRTSGEISNTEAMSSSYQPPWVAIANPIIGVIGVMAGAQLRNR